MKKITFFTVIFLILVLLGIFGLSKMDKHLNEMRNPTPSPSPESSQQTSPSEVTSMGASEASVIVQITSPSDKAAIASPSVTVRGKTLPLAEVFVNDTETKADENGNFSASINLDEGENIIMVAANDSMGNAGETEIAVTYKGE
jgi:hypothetical protein